MHPSLQAVIAQLLNQRNHFDCGDRRVEALVAGFSARSIDGLLQRVCRQNAETNRNTRRYATLAKPLVTSAAMYSK